MLRTPPNSADRLDSWQGGGQEAGAAVGDNQVDPFWPVGPQLHSQSSLVFIVAEIGRPDTAGRLNSPGGLIVV